MLDKIEKLTRFEEGVAGFIAWFFLFLIFFSGMRRSPVIIMTIDLIGLTLKIRPGRSVSQAYTFVY